MDAPCSGHVLLVGDGDFSFSVSLLNNGTFSASHMTTSNIDTLESIEQHKLAADNMTTLKQLGASVLLEVDACELHVHPTISSQKYERIIFNFPLSDRHNIKKNRSLLADFFSSSSQILTDEGQVMVTLCKGQGGTPADNPVRSWHDSWQVQAMASNSGFILTQILPFNALQYPGYHSVGFRFQDKSFNTEGALTHIFERAESVSVPDDTRARGTITTDGISYSCSSYVAQSLSRNLLEGKGPLHLLKISIENILKDSMNISVIQDQEAWQVVSGMRSAVYSKRNQNSSCLGDEEISDNIEYNSCTEELEKGKEKKNELNLNTARKDQKQTLKNNFEHGVVEGVFNTADSSASQIHAGSSLVLEDSELVYILIKNSSPACRDTDGDADHPSSCCGEDVTQKLHNEELELDCSDRIFHFRTSMLETLGMILSSQSGHYTISENKKIRVVSPIPSFVVSGQCMSVCPITADCLPLQHEMMIVIKVDDDVNNSSISAHCTQPNFDTVSNELISCLTKFELLTALTFHANSENIEVVGFDKCELKMFGTVTDVNNSPKTGVVLLNIYMNTEQYLVCLLKLDIIACSVCQINDPRLLHSQSSKFLKQFESGLPHKLQPFCLFPMKFSHDLSFWENGEFPENDFYNIVRYVSGNLVVSVSLVDVYTDPVSARRSRCYRLHFLSHDQAFSYLISWKFQSIIRMEVANKLGVSLR